MKSLLTFTLLILILTTAVVAQEAETKRVDDVSQAKLIKIKRMSQAWKNLNMDLVMDDGTIHTGKFVSIIEREFHIKSKTNVMQFPFSGVYSVILIRKKRDLILVGLTAVGVAALFTGGVSLGFEAGDEVKMGAAGVGAGVGLFVGWKAFYQNIVIPLK